MRWSTPRYRCCAGGETDDGGCAEPLDAEVGPDGGAADVGSGFQYFFKKLHGHTNEGGRPGNGDGFAYAALELLAAADGDGSGTLSSGELAAAPGPVRDFCDATLRTFSARTLKSASSTSVPSIRVFSRGPS